MNSKVATFSTLDFMYRVPAEVISRPTASTIQANGQFRRAEFVVFNKDNTVINIYNDKKVLIGSNVSYFGYSGKRKDYFQLTEKYLRKMEKEAHIKEPMAFSYPSGYLEDDFKWE